MTVKEAFSKAFGEVPEAFDVLYLGLLVGTHGVGITINDAYYTWNPESIPPSWGCKSDSMWQSFNKKNAINISDRDAHAFAGFFGEAYDRVLDGAE